RRLALKLAIAALVPAATMDALGQGERPDPAVRPITAFYDALLATMKEAQRLGFQGRYDKLAPVIRATYDFPAMTRIAVGPDWNTIAADVQTQLVENFAQMTIATYANRFDGYSGERFEVEPATETRSTGRLVRTKLVPGKGEPVVLNYLMRGSGETWKVVDVYLTGTISELATRRTEFAAILKAGGPGALVDSLRQQADKQRAPGPGKPDAPKR
ncbi:MAG TPA: ABC transporter substrate-binding protein, partial [Casimicrobiaceae bacterium]|nr:ABC transporter substrate-binding protein [Casimicrobiaceae bacterium]